MSAASAGEQRPQQIALEELSVEQLSQIKQQLDEVRPNFQEHSLLLTMRHR